MTTNSPNAVTAPNAREHTAGSTTLKHTRSQLAVAENALLEILACKDFSYAKGIARRALDFNGIARAQPK